MVWSCSLIHLVVWKEVADNKLWSSSRLNKKKERSVDRGKESCSMADNVLFFLFFCLFFWRKMSLCYVTCEKSIIVLFCLSAVMLSKIPVFLYQVKWWIDTSLINLPADRQLPSRVCLCSEECQGFIFTCFAVHCSHRNVCCAHEPIGQLEMFKLVRIHSIPRKCWSLFTVKIKQFVFSI